METMFVGNVITWRFPCSGIYRLTRVSWNEWCFLIAWSGIQEASWIRFMLELSLDPLTQTLYSERERINLHWGWMYLVLCVLSAPHRALHSCLAYI